MGNYHPSKTNVNLIWRNGVLCTNLHSGHLEINIDRIQHNRIYSEKNYFQITQPLAIRKYFFLIWFCTLFTPELECISLFKHDVNVYHSVSYKPDDWLILFSLRLIHNVSDISQQWIKWKKRRNVVKDIYDTCLYSLFMFCAIITWFHNGKL